MTQVVRFPAPHQVEVVAEEPSKPRAGQVRVRTLYSGISTGTELTAYRGSNPYLSKGWDSDHRLFAHGGSTFEYPLTGWGYQEVGEVVEVGDGVSSLRVGDLVWGIWGHRSEAVLDADRLTGHILSPEIDPLAGVFARVGAIALNATFEASIHLAEDVAVFGQGVIGLLATRLATLNGGRVVAVDTLADRLRLAREYGARTTLDASECGAAEAIKKLTEGRGADVCVELSGTYAALHEAIRAAAVGGRVTAAGFYQGQANNLCLGEEFHHNRVQVTASQISGVSPDLAGRWDVERLQRTFMQLITEGAVDTEPLVTHVVQADDVAQAFALLDHAPGQALQVVLQF